MWIFFVVVIILLFLMMLADARQGRGIPRNPTIYPISGVQSGATAAPAPAR
jgi:hypothetical protein